MHQMILLNDEVVVILFLLDTQLQYAFRESD